MIADGPPVKPAIEDAADVTKALAGAADAANICIALSLMVNYLVQNNSSCPAVYRLGVSRMVHDMNDESVPVPFTKHAYGTPTFMVPNVTDDATDRD